MCTYGIDIKLLSVYNVRVILRKGYRQFIYCQVKEMCKLFSNFKKNKIKVVKGKDGKKGVKLDGKIVIPVKCDSIEITEHNVRYVLCGVIHVKSIEDLNRNFNS